MSFAWLIPSRWRLVAAVVVAALATFAMTTFRCPRCVAGAKCACTHSLPEPVTIAVVCASAYLVVCGATALWGRRSRGAA